MGDIINYFNFLDIRNVALFFDHFGILVWIFIIWVSVDDLRNTKYNSDSRFNWIKRILLIIGILGLIVDGGMVFGLYMK